MSNSGVTCGGCRRPMPATENVPLEGRQPCPDCGSLARAIAVTASDGLTFHGGLGLKLRRAGSPKVVQEQFVGAEQSAPAAARDQAQLGAPLSERVPRAHQITTLSARRSCAGRRTVPR